MINTCLMAMALMAADPGTPDGPTRALGLYKPGPAVGLEEGFRDPPPICRAQCWWQCHGSAWTKADITRQLEQFKAQGMGGATVKDTLPMPRDEQTAQLRDIPYMSPEWLDMFAHMTAECQRLGLILRSRFGSGWNEGGPWVTPEMSSQVLAFARSQPLAGPSRYSGPIPTADGGLPAVKALKSGEAFVVAVPGAGGRGVNLTDKVTADGKLAWDVPAGTWNLVSCFSRPSGIPNMSTSSSGAGLHHDHLSTAAADVQLENVVGRILAKLGPFERTAFDGLNTDSWELGTPTWTPGMRQAFIARRGYDPVPYLPVLARVRSKTKHASMGPAEIVGHPTDEQLRFLFDFRTTVSDLIVENFCRHVERWCLAHHVAYEAQAGGPVYVPRDMLQAQGAADIPMGEFWAHPWTCVKVPASAAHAYGRRLVGLESLTDTTFNAKHNHISTSPTQMKLRVDEAFLLGGNYLTMAVVEYSPAAAGLPGWVHNCGPHLNPNQTWWPMAHGFFDYLGRCCFLLQSGRDVAQVAVYHTFRTADDFRWHEPGNTLSKWPKQFAFDYVGDELVQEQMSVRDGRIVLRSGATYGILCVDPTPRPTMPLDTLRKIRDLIRQGANVVWTARPPAVAPGLTGYPQCDVEFRAILQELQDRGQLHVLPSPDYASLVPLMEKCVQPPAWHVEGDPPLRFVHRRTRDADIFFVVNRGDWQVRTPVTFRIQGRRAELWDPDTGRIEAADVQPAAKGTCVSVCLPAFGSTFVVFRGQGSTPASKAKSPAGRKPLEPIAIDGPWEVAFPSGWQAPSKATFSKLQSWTASDEPGIRFFSGIATYRTEFDCPASAVADGPRASLDLGRVAEVCEVRLNGRLLGIGWHPPYRFDASRQLVAGRNRLEIRVANLWHNRLVGDADLPKAKRASRMVPEKHYEMLRGMKLMESGLLGPVRMIVGSSVR
jgi:hypothetical protein